MFYQHVTHEVLKALIKSKYPLLEKDGGDENEGLTREEENALRYVAGYVIRKLVKKVHSSSFVNKDDLIQCLHDMRDIIILL